MDAVPPPPLPWRATDLGHLTPDQRAVLGRVLDEAEVPWDVVGGELRTPASEADLVDALVARAASTTGDHAHDAEVFSDLAVVDGQPVVDGPTLAAPGRRLLAYAVETVVLGLLLLAVRAASGAFGSVFGLLLGAGNAVVLVTVLGGTAGMLAFGLRVVPSGVDLRSDPEPRVSWGTAIVRYLVVVWPFLLTRAVDPTVGTAPSRWLSALATVWTVLCFGAILVDPMRRGLHDRAARTLVLDVRTSSHRAGTDVGSGR